MSDYTVLARKYRPKDFAEVVGQEHVVEAMKNSILNHKLHSVYLLSGTRGIGKTTLARIFTKAMSCENFSTNLDCCGYCASCKQIDENADADLIEVDAASKTKVEDTRELIESLAYPPLYSAYKVFIIDEVHMLTVQSFNALLKTLEEPPPYAKFILCTTDPQKIPATVLSRCLHFHLKPLTEEQIASQVKKILTQEHIPFEDKAVNVLAKAGNGSIRDCLSLTDQAIAIGNQQVLTEKVYQMIGLVSDDLPTYFVINLIEGDYTGAAEYFDEIARQQTDWSSVTNQILTILYQFAIMPFITSGDYHKYGVDNEIVIDYFKEPYIDPSSFVERIQLLIEIFNQLLRQLTFSANPKQAFHISMLRALAFRPTEVINIDVIRADEFPNFIQPKVVQLPVVDKSGNLVTQAPGSVAALMARVPANGNISPTTAVLKESSQIGSADNSAKETQVNQQVGGEQSKTPQTSQLQTNQSQTNNSQNTSLKTNHPQEMISGPELVNKSVVTQASESETNLPDLELKPQYQDSHQNYHRDSNQDSDKDFLTNTSEPQGLNSNAEQALKVEADDTSVSKASPEGKSQAPNGAQNPTNYGLNSDQTTNLNSKQTVTPNSVSTGIKNLPLATQSADLVISEEFNLPNALKFNELEIAQRYENRDNFISSFKQKLKERVTTVTSPYLKQAFTTLGEKLEELQAQKNNIFIHPDKLIEVLEANISKLPHYEIYQLLFDNGATEVSGVSRMRFVYHAEAKELYFYDSEADANENNLGGVSGYVQEVEDFLNYGEEHLVKTGVLNAMFVISSYAELQDKGEVFSLTNDIETFVEHCYFEVAEKIRVISGQIHKQAFAS